MPCKIIIIRPSAASFVYTMTLIAVHLSFLREATLAAIKRKEKIQMYTDLN